MSTLNDVKKIVERTIYDLDRRDILISKQRLKQELNDSEIYRTFIFKDDEEDIYLSRAIEKFKLKKEKEYDECKTTKSILKQKQNILGYKASIKNLQQKLDDKQEMIIATMQEHENNRQFVKKQQKQLTELIDRKEKIFTDDLIYKNNVLEKELIKLKGYNEALFLQKVLYTCLCQAKLTPEGKVIVPTDQEGNSSCLHAFIYGIIEKAIQETKEEKKKDIQWTKLLIGALKEPPSAIALFQQNINMDNNTIISKEQKEKIENDFLKLQNSLNDLNSDVK